MSDEGPAAVQATRLMQELAEHYRKLANGSTIFCMDTDVSPGAVNSQRVVGCAEPLLCWAAQCCAVLCCAALCCSCSDMLSHCFKLCHVVLCFAGLSTTPRYTQVQQCAHVRESSDKAELCEGTAARQACHRTCGRCHADFDSSQMVWYNQPQNAAVDTSVADASRVQDEDDLSDLSSTKRTDIGAAVSLLNGVLLRSKGDLHAHANGGIGGETGAASETAKEESHSNSSAVENHRDRSSEGQISKGAGLSDATESARSLVSNNKGIARTRSWKEHVSNPFCVSLLFLCLVMLACMLFLAKMRFRRKRLPR